MEGECLSVMLWMFLLCQNWFVLPVEQPRHLFSLQSPHTVQWIWLCLSFTPFTPLHRASASVDQPMWSTFHVGSDRSWWCYIMYKVVRHEYEWVETIDTWNVKVKSTFLSKKNKVMKPVFVLYYLPSLDVSKFWQQHAVHKITKTRSTFWQPETTLCCSQSRLPAIKHECKDRKPNDLTSHDTLCYVNEDSTVKPYRVSSRCLDSVWKHPKATCRRCC